MKSFYCLAFCLVAVVAISMSTGCNSKTDGAEGGAFGDLPGGAAPGTINDGSTPGAFGEPGAGVKPSDQWAPIPGVTLPTVYFAYDSSNIGTSEASKIQMAVDHLNQNPDHNLIIEGHCDERGSLEYNRALGERRAIAVRDAIVGMGIAENRTMTISYGEEKPVIQGSNENSWSKNRRAEMIPAK